jgi:hypothetical protein
MSWWILTCTLKSVLQVRSGQVRATYRSWFSIPFSCDERMHADYCATVFSENTLDLPVQICYAQSLSHGIKLRLRAQTLKMEDEGFSHPTPPNVSAQQRGLKAVLAYVTCSRPW